MSSDAKAGAPSFLTYLIDRRERIATVLMAVAGVVTTWCAFESTKWGGIQSMRFNEAAAARVESSRSEVAGNQELQVDIAMFIAWLEALQVERGPGHISREGPYHPDPGTVSGFLFERFRHELRPAVEAWVALKPGLHPDAPTTPFVMPQYHRTKIDRAHELSAKAEERAAAAREAIRTSDNYMLTTVLAALVVFFAGIASQLVLRANGVALLALAFLTLIACCVVLLQLPVTVL